MLGFSPSHSVLSCCPCRHKCMNHRQTIMFPWVETVFKLCFIALWGTDTSSPTIIRFTQQQQRLLFLDKQDKGLRVTLVSLLPQPSNPAYLCRGGKSLHVHIYMLHAYVSMCLWCVCVCKWYSTFTSILKKCLWNIYAFHILYAEHLTSSL